MVEAARRLPAVKFYMTGNPKKAAERIGADPPPNLIVTGFIETSKFGELMQRAGAVMALTTWDHTMQRGAWEAIYQGTPVIVSDFPILREAFDEGAIHVPNSADAVVAAVERVRTNLEEYRGGAVRLRARKETRWHKTKQELLAAIGKSPTRN
jgi:glycosyltransferase involved in cell wall biosynthesis